ncbi:MAG: hypothetical protein MI806_12920 [Minwuiales bacterium]|nr:hypothetical protein [Minwuiales bacterium]
MHKSRLGAIVIDCETDDLDGDAAFWSGALGGTPDRSSDPQFSNYVALRDSPAGPHVLIQKVDHPSRVHIDIESDDIDAEADRLEKLGAKRIARVKRWWVMQAPSGQRFCVVPPQREDFETGANQWP